MSGVYWVLAGTLGNQGPAGYRASGGIEGLLADVGGHLVVSGEIRRYRGCQRCIGG